MPTDNKISQLPTGTAINGNDIFPFTHGITGSATPETQQAAFTLLNGFLNSYFISGSHTLLNGKYQPTGTFGASPAYIDGLDIDYTTSGSITVNPGSAYVPSLGRIVMVTGSITQSIPIVASNATGSWQNVYLYESAGVPLIQVTGTAPSNPYSGVARTKNGDNSMRYIGSVFLDAGGYLHRFASEVIGNTLKINWIASQVSSVFEPITNSTGTNTTPLTFPVGQFIPLAGTVIELHTQLIINLPPTTEFVGAVGETLLGTAFANNFQSAEAYVRFLNASASVTTSAFLPYASIKLSGTTMQFITLQLTGNGSSLTIRIRGNTIQR